MARLIGRSAEPLAKQWLKWDLLLLGMSPFQDRQLLSRGLTETEGAVCVRLGSPSTAQALA